MTFGQRLRILRTSRGWKQTKLAQVAGLTQGMITDLERDRYGPSGAALGRLADALDVSADVLLRGVEVAAAGEPLWLREFARLGHLLAPAQRDALIELARALAGEPQAQAVGDNEEGDPDEGAAGAQAVQGDRESA